MSLNPLARITDYQSMLNRIFWFTATSALVAIWLLRQHSPNLDTLLNKIDFTLEFNGDKVLPLPGGYLIPALAVGLLSRIYRLHAHVSDWLGIRERFDVDVIVEELAAQVDVDIAQVADEHLVNRRQNIMRDAFYRFVNSPHPLIDPHLVEQALDAWSWFWIGVETTLVFTVTGFALVANGNYVVGIETIGGTLLGAVIGLPAMRAQCRRYAIAQVRAICSDPARADAVRTALAELPGSRTAGRRAA